jgi:ribosome-associated protein
MTDEHRPEASQPPSKSQRKRDARALFELGRALVALDPASLQNLPLERGLREQLEFARGLKANVARKRHLQYIAKLLRRTDTGPIAAAIEATRLESRRQASRHHRVEAWRDCLLTTGDQALTALVGERPETDPQPLRQLLRKARREATAEKPPAAARQLFRLLREMDQADPLPPPPDA